MTPRETHATRHWLLSRFGRRLSARRGRADTVAPDRFSRICQVIEGEIGREAMAVLLSAAAFEILEETPPEGLRSLTDDNLLDLIVGVVKPGVPVAAVDYRYEWLDVETLRRRRDITLLAEFVAFYDSKGARPTIDDFGAETMARFPGDIEAYHHIADIDLRTKDDATKFRFVRGGSKQPMLRSKKVNPNEWFIHNHPCRPLADELSARMTTVCLTANPLYQQARLKWRGQDLKYRFVTLPLFDSSGACTHSLVAMTNLERAIPGPQANPHIPRR